MAHYSDLINLNVLVTGGANGIGAAIVRAFHSQGANIFFCDTDREAGQKLTKELGTRITFKKVDLNKENEIRLWLSGLKARREPLHVLVNNAAVDPRLELENSSLQFWDRLFATNLRACFLICREAVPQMPPEGGSIINLGSITFHRGPAHMSAYVASKGGIIGFTRSLARELGPRRIRVNTVSPGWVMTQRQLRQNVTPAVKRLIRNSQCIPDLLNPEEIAQVVLFLASNASGAITGQEILADRGWACH